ncbi:uncharacterized protein LOC144558698 [Carex rostrata]
MAFGERTMEGERENIYDEPKRLSDFLRESDEELLVEINSKTEFQKISAKSGSGLNVSRFLWFGRRGQSKKQEEEYKDIMKKDFSPVLCNPSATKSGNTSLTLGMGIGLYVLLSKSTSEYSKMAELHKQMKTLLEEIKKELENKSRVCSCCSTASDLSCYLHKICDEENKCGKGDTQCVKMNQMESELEIELERMRFNFSEDSSSLTQEEQGIQIPVEWTDFCENSSSKFEQFDETWQDDCNQNYGVSPHELERKLHELLNHRQQERIEELESQLHSLERKLLERESEINRWKAIATTSSKTE